MPLFPTKISQLLIDLGLANAVKSGVGCIVRGISGQTGDLAQFQNSAKSVLAKVNASGVVSSAVGTAAGNVATVDGTQTLTNKTLTGAIVDGLQYASVNVSSAELLALFTTAKQLVATPGAGKVIEFVRATITYNHVATDYTINGSTNLSVKYKDKTGADVSTTRATTGFIDGATAYSMFQPLTAQLVLDTNAVNQPLCLALAAANPTLGDGTLKVNVVYRVHTL